MNATYRPPEEFTTERFVVRRIRPYDAAAIFAGWATDPDVTKYLTWRPHVNVAETKEVTTRFHSDWDGTSSFPAVICPRDARSELIGSIHARVSGSKVSYGWLVRKDHWGRGVASEVARWAIRHAFSHRQIYRTEAACDIDNVASARVMRNAGMTLDALLRRYLQHPNVSSEPRDAFLYSRVR
ncbi:GNAT family N-acetyltransferase [Rhizobium sp. BR 314]|uniref:GNAT family N-acetyltransferase n=1 Tax=Rhizobium sp. BR 314 TaxID=3040013 RepID=UPI0039BEE214